MPEVHQVKVLASAKVAESVNTSYQKRLVTHIVKYNQNFGFSCDSMLTAKWLTDEVNHQSINQVSWILNMTKVEMREFVYELLEEFIPIFDAPYFFIGGEE